MSANQSRFGASEYNSIPSGVYPVGKPWAARGSEARFADIQATFPLSRRIPYPALSGGTGHTVFSGIGGTEDGPAADGTAPHQSTAQNFLI